MTQTANNDGEVLFELGIKKDTVEEKTEKEQIEASIKTESICA